MYQEKIGESLKQLINDVRELRVSGDLADILSCLQKMAANPDDIIKALPEFDTDEVLLYVDDDITVYRIATTPGIIYPPHEHGMTAISAIYKGTETHVFYDRDGENVIERSRVRFCSPAIVDMEPSAVHAICNEDDEPNESLHFYFGDLETQRRTLWDQNGKNPQQYIHEDYLSFSRPFD